MGHAGGWRGVNGGGREEGGGGREEGGGEGVMEGEGRKGQRRRGKGGGEGRSILNQYKQNQKGTSKIKVPVLDFINLLSEMRPSYQEGSTLNKNGSPAARK